MFQKTFQKYPGMEVAHMRSSWNVFLFCSVKYRAILRPSILEEIGIANIFCEMP